MPWSMAHQFMSKPTNEVGTGITQSSLTGLPHETIPRKRYPVGAALLSFPVLGLGQLYNAQPKKAVVIYLLSLSMIPVLSMTTMPLTFSGALFLLLVSLVFFGFVMADAAKNARRLGSITLQKYNKVWVYVCIFLLHAFLITTVLEIFFPRSVKAFKIPSGGMLPTLEIGDHLIVDLTYYAKHEPRRGDVAVFIFPEEKSKDFIQRVIGLPGETVEIRRKKVFVNGQELSEPWTHQFDEKSAAAQANFGPKVVPVGAYFLLGDNRDHSYDSRFWGFVDRSLFKAKALYIYWAADKGRIGATIN